MTYKVIPGLIYNGMPVYTEDVIVSANGGIDTVPNPDPVIIFPTNLQNRITIGRQQLPWIPWQSTNRRVSPAKLNDSNMWVLHFTVSTSNPRIVRIQAGEYPIDGSPAVSRNSILIRDKDSKIISTQHGNTITQLLAFPGQVTYPPAPFDVMVRKQYADIVLNESYTFVLWNDIGQPASTMLCELYL